MHFTTIDVIHNYLQAQDSYINLFGGLILINHISTMEENIDL